MTKTTCGAANDRVSLPKQIGPALCSSHRAATDASGWAYGGPNMSWSNVLHRKQSRCCMAKRPPGRARARGAPLAESADTGFLWSCVFRCGGSAGDVEVVMQRASALELTPWWERLWRCPAFPTPWNSSDLALVRPMREACMAGMAGLQDGLSRQQRGCRRSSTTMPVSEQGRKGNNGAFDCFAEAIRFRFVRASLGRMKPSVVERIATKWRCRNQRACLARWRLSTQRCATSSRRWSRWFASPHIALAQTTRHAP